MSARETISSGSRWLQVYLTPISVFLLVGIVFALDGWRERRDLVEAEQQILLVRATLVENALETLLNTVDSQLSDLADKAPTKTGIETSSMLEARLSQLKRLAPVASLLIIDPSGKVVAHSNPANVGYDASQREHYLVHTHKLDLSAGNLYLSRPFYTHDGLHVLSLSRRLNDAHGRFLGIAAATITLKAMGSILHLGFDRDDLKVSLVNRAGGVLLRLPEAEQHADLNIGQTPDFRAHQDGKSRVSTHVVESQAGDDGRISGIRDLERGGLTVVVARDTRKAVAAWRNSSGLRLLILLAFGLTIGFLTRIVRQRQLEADRASALYSGVVRNTSDVIMIFDREARVSYVSPAVARVTGFPQERGVGMQFSDFCHREDYPEVAAIWQRLVSEPGSSHRLHFRVLHRDGRWIHVEAIASSHFETEGIRGVILVARDVTERVVAEALLRDSEETLKRAQAVAQIGSWHLDGRTGQMTWSDETCRICGITPGSRITQRRFFKMVHPDDRDTLHAEWIAALAGEPFDCGHRIVVNGNIIWVNERADFVFDGAGRMVSCTGTMQDVTAQQLAATQLSELLEFTEKIIAESPVGIAVYHANGPCVLANASIARMAGTTVEEARGQNFRRLASWRELGLLDAAMEALQSGRPVRKVASGKTSFGATVALDCEFATIMRQGERHLLLLANDVSDFKKAEQALINATHMAEEASRAKSEFLANMSHEIRTPMNAVIGLAQLALNQTDDPTLREYLRQMFDSGTALLRIINNILDYSKIEAGELDLEEHEFEPRELAESVLRMFRLGAEAKGIRLSATVAPNVPSHLEGDATRLNQVLVNLLGNAVKFTSKGGIDLLVERIDSAEPEDSADDTPRCRIRFVVSDTGVGIEEAHLPRLFQPFVQADGSITRRFGGTGLGLSISRRLVLLMGGDITVDSTPGAGSRFQFSLEFKIGKAPEDLPGPSPSPDLTGNDLATAAMAIAGARILVVEDDILNRRVIDGLLTSAGLRPSVASDGGEALVALEKTAFDAILMDLNLQVIDGYEATRRIRARKEWSGIPIIAVTASALGDTREKCIDAGMDDFLSKPVRPMELIATLVRHLSTPSAIARQALPEDGPRARQLRKHLELLRERLSGNDFISAVELARLRELTAPLGGEAGARLETAISHYDYTHAKILIDDMIATLGGTPPLNTKES